MSEIRDKMVRSAKEKLAFGGLSQVDRSYYEGLIADYTRPAAAGNVQEAAATPAAKSPAARPFGAVDEQAEMRRLFGVCSKPAASGARIQEQAERARLFGRTK